MQTRTATARQPDSEMQARRYGHTKQHDRSGTSSRGSTVTCHGDGVTGLAPRRRARERGRARPIAVPGSNTASEVASFF